MAAASRETGLELLDACLAAINTATADINLESPDVDALVDGVLAGGSPSECDFIDNTDPDELGLTRDEVARRVEAALPPEAVDYLARPVRTEFEFEADEM